MPRFHYHAKDKSGTKITGAEEAQSEDALITRLQAQGLYVISIKPFEQAVEEIAVELKRGHRFSHSKVKIDDLVVFSRQLATMMDAGVTLLKSLEIISQQAESKVLFNCLNQVKKDLERGVSFCNALAKHPKVFSPFWVSLVEVGEASGTLPLILERVATYIEEKAAFQAKIISSLLYPLVLLVVCFGAISFFALKIVPRFAEIFKSFNIKLPLLTQIILGVFGFIRTKFLLLFLIIFGIIICVRKYTQTTKGKEQFERLLFGLPVFGYFLKVVIIERFASQMAILIESGVPILYSLEISQRMILNRTMEKVIDDIKNNVREGKLIAEPMGKTAFFTPMIVQMVLVGEETGELSRMFKHVAGFYQRYVSNFLERLSTLLEPALLIFVGAIVGVIVISMFLPIFSIATMGGGGLGQ